MSTELEKRGKHEVTNTSAERMIDSGKSYRPDVDIYNTEENLILVMDMPGVKKGDVNLEVDENNALIIKAKSGFIEPEGIVYRGFNTGNYYRAFTLSNEFNKDNISAHLENGVLEVTIPRREEVKPKRIEIKV